MIDNEQLEKLHSKLLSILIKFDLICKENNLVYWLDSGTLLGAVRHSGFIPWDDDVDVAMPVEDFDKLLHLPSQCFPEDIELQKPEECNQHFAKIRDCNSLFLEHGEILSEQYNQGVYIDIFPMIKYPNLREDERKKLVLKFQKVWINIQKSNRKQKTSLKNNLHFFYLKNKWKLLDFRNSTSYCSLPEDNGCNRIHDTKDLYPLSTINFEGHSFPCPNNSHNYLTDLYDDYSIIPPENKRTNHVDTLILGKKSLFKEVQKKTVFAPVAIFVFNRLDNTKKTIESLKKNYYANETDIYIFSDAAKKNDFKNEKKVRRVRKYLKTIIGFKSVTIIERPENFYIEKNIIEGVNQVLSIFDRIIVLEDDVLTSINFLRYMNMCLNFYKTDYTIAEISGWQTVENISADSKTIFWKYLEIGGGWATWKDRWINFKYFETEEDALSYLGDDGIKAIQFHNSFNCLNTLKLNPIPWDICWFISIIKNNQLTVSPTKSFTKNNGLYNGSHFSNNRLFHKSKYDVKVSKNDDFLILPNSGEDLFATARLESHFLQNETEPTILAIIGSLLTSPYRIAKKIAKKILKILLFPNRLVLLFLLVQGLYSTYVFFNYFINY